MKPTLIRGQAGVTLIELMISMVIALVIMVAVAGAYVGASTAGKASEAQGRMNEDAQMALGILAQQLRIAGTNPAQPNRAPTSLHNQLALTSYGIKACDITFTNVSATVTAAALTCAHTASSTGPASISIGYEADIYNTVPTSGGIPTDCMGSALGATTAVATTDAGATVTATFYEAENRFYIGTSTAITSPSLYCKGNASSAQPLVENIEDLEFSFGTSTPVNTTTVAGYQDAYDVENEAATLGAATSKERWTSFVKTVRICVVVRSAEPVSPDTSSGQYYDCGGALITPTDLRLRRAYTTTVVLRNQ